MGLKKVEKSGKNLLIRLVRVFIKPEKLDRGKVDFSKVKRILLVRQDKRLGNLILTLPVVSAIRKKFPQSHIGYLADEKFADMLTMSPEIDEVIVIKKSSFRNPFQFLSIIKKIRKTGFDMTVDLSDENNFSLSNAFLTYLSQAPIRAGYQKEQNKGFLNVEVPIIHKERHVVERHLDLWRFLAGEVPTPEFNLKIDFQNKSWAENYLTSKKVSQNDFLMGIHIGGRGKKRWSIENFAEVINWLSKENYKIIIFWGKEEEKLLPDLRKKSNAKIIISDLLPVQKLAGVIKRCNLFISSDTGPMHLAVALKVPTLAIFTDSDAKKYGPKGELHRIVSDEISLEKVKATLKEMLDVSQTVLK